MAIESHKVSVVMPCYKVSGQLGAVVSQIGPEVDRIYIVDDDCPEGSVDQYKKSCNDSRVIFLKNSQNLGVGGAVLTGYQEAISEQMDIVVKIDGDGQMDPKFIRDFVEPIIRGEADYAKGNRFFDLRGLKSMPPLRLFGNAILSLLTKLSSGYWNLFDPTNGYTAIHIDILKNLPLTKISKDYFFESDMLFRLNILRTVVVDVPMSSFYGEEQSNLRISKIIGPFAWKHLRNTFKRLFYNYYLRDMSVASFQLPLGSLLFYLA